jgi:UPF0271 protein
VGRLGIDLSADVGEGFGAWSMGDDALLFPFLTSVNVACGFHAGDPGVMDRTVAAAARAGLAVGAHPGYADLRGFGRFPMALPPEVVEADVLYQVAALAGFARAHGAALSHAKPHGALYNQAAADATLARAVARGVARFSRELVLVGLAGSAPMAEAAREEGLRFAGEGFPDRRYEGDGTLRARARADALVLEPEAVAAQAVAMARDGRVAAADGRPLAVRAETLCLHGDHPKALANARAVRAALAEAGVEVRPLGA